jgi:hypothetical protein
MRVLSGAGAEAAVGRLAEMSPDLRGCAVLDLQGRALAANGGDPERWAEAGAARPAGAQPPGGERARHLPLCLV